MIVLYHILKRSMMKMYNIDDVEEKIKNNKNKDTKKLIMYLFSDISNLQEIDVLLNSIISKDERVMYSLFTNYVFRNNDRSNDIYNDYFHNNIGKLIEKYDELNEKNKIKILLKIEDHVNLANIQFSMQKEIEKNITEELRSNVEELKKENTFVNENLEKSKKDYITILGIFAAIVITFASGMSFSSSVISNLNDVNAFLLMLVIITLGLIEANILYLLLSFIRRLSLKHEKHDNRTITIFNIGSISGILIILLIKMLYNV